MCASRFKVECTFGLVSRTPARHTLNILECKVRLLEGNFALGVAALEPKVEQLPTPGLASRAQSCGAVALDTQIARR